MKYWRRGRIATISPPFVAGNLSSLNFFALNFMQDVAAFVAFEGHPPPPVPLSVTVICYHSWTLRKYFWRNSRPSNPTHPAPLRPSIPPLETYQCTFSYTSIPHIIQVVSLLCTFLDYFPEYARQKRVVHKKHKVMKRVRPQTK